MALGPHGDLAVWITLACTHNTVNSKIHDESDRRTQGLWTCSFEGTAVIQTCTTPKIALSYVIFLHLWDSLILKVFNQKKQPSVCLSVCVCIPCERQGLSSIPSTMLTISLPIPVARWERTEIQRETHKECLYECEFWRLQKTTSYQHVIHLAVIKVQRLS